MADGNLCHNDGEQSKIAFVLGDFPQLSQTFIYRELETLWQNGHRFSVISTKKTDLPNSAISETLAEIRGHTRFINHRSFGFYGGIIRETLKSPVARETFAWLQSLGHQTKSHRLRSLAAVGVAVHLVPWLKEREITYLHSHFAGFQTEIAMACARMLGISWGGSWHAYGIYKDKNLLAEKIDSAQVLVSCTQHNVNHLQGIAPQNRHKIVLAYHGVNCESFANARLSTSSSSQMVLAIGRLVEKKGFANLITAFGRVAKTNKNVTLHIIGDGPERQSLAALAAATEGVHFLGGKSNSQVIEELGKCRMLVVPSIQGKDGNIDGLPNVVLEAMASARPVVASEMSGIPEAVTDGKQGFLVPPGDVDALVEKMLEILGDDALADRMGAAGLDEVDRRFTAKQNAQVLWQTIQGCHS